MKLPKGPKVQVTVEEQVLNIQVNQAGLRGERGFPGQDGRPVNVEYFTVTELEVLNKEIILQEIALSPEKSRLEFVNGTVQQYAVDYVILDGNRLSWDSLGLDNFMEENDIIRVEYW
jgi:hypothetical protein